MDFLAGYQKVRIERRGKIAQEYALIQKVYQDTYLAVKTTGGERPRKVFFINLKESERNK